MHLRNTPTTFTKNLGDREDYRYARYEAGGFAVGESYLPNDVRHKVQRFYESVDRGMKAKIEEKLGTLGTENSEA